MATFVLVHGACHGGWCWARVAERLLAAGHAVHAPTLSGTGDRAHLAGQAINLSTHIEDVVALLTAYDLTDVVLCGHSYGGMVTTGVAGLVAERVRTLFYLDGCVPQDGQSLFDIVGPDRALAFLGMAGATGLAVPPPPAAAYGLVGADAEWVDRRCTPHPLACLVQRLRLTGRESIVPRRTYVLARRFVSAYHRIHERVSGEEGWRTAVLDCGHEAMIEAPDEVAALLLEEPDR